MCEKVFSRAKEALSSCDVLMPYDPELPLKVTTDASPYRVGAVLAHVVEGHERPIAYASRTLNSAEK